MAQVHPSAIIDERACLEEGVTIGPGCIIEGEVRVGSNTRLLANVHLFGPVTLGRDNVLYPNTCLGYAGQHRAIDHDKPGAGLIVGDGNVLREGVSIHRAIGDRPTTVGDHNYLMVNAHVGHDSVVGNHCVLANCALLGGHVAVADNAIVSGNAAVHQFCRIGRLALISGCQGITQDLPPFCVCYVTRTVSSLNLVGLRRAGLREHIGPLKRAFDIFFRSGHANGRAIRRIESELGDDPLCLELIQFIRHSERGITPYASAHEGQRHHASEITPPNEALS